MLYGTSHLLYVKIMTENTFEPLDEGREISVAQRAALTLIAVPIITGLLQAISSKLEGKSKDYANGYRDGVNLAKEELERKATENRSTVKMFEQQDQDKIQDYINSFRNKIGQYIDSNVGQEISVCGFADGIIINLRQGLRLPNIDKIIGIVPSLKEALALLDINDYSGSPTLLQAVKDNKKPSDATGYFFAGDSFFMIKGKDDAYWSKSAAIEDIETINSYMLQLQERAKKVNVSTPMNPPKP